MFLQEHYTTYNKVIKTDDIAIPQNIFTVQLEQAIHQAFRLLTVRFKLYIGTYVHRHKNIAIFTVRSYTVVIIPGKNSTKIPIHPTILFLFNLSPLGLHKTVTSGMLSKSDKDSQSLLLKDAIKKHSCCRDVIQSSKLRCFHTAWRPPQEEPGKCRNVFLVGQLEERCHENVTNGDLLVDCDRLGRFRASWVIWDSLSA